MTDSTDRTARVVRVIADTAVVIEKYFGDLDAVVGDGDFGYSLARGFELIQSDWDSIPQDTPTDLLKNVAQRITSRIGGTSGPIWGTAFLRAAITVKDKDELSGADVVAMLRAAMDGIKARGSAELGDKTLLDALSPATDELEKSVADGDSYAVAVRRMATTARTAADDTAKLQARRGRASYSGERSIGSVDAGAVAVAVILEALSAHAEN